MIEYDGVQYKVFDAHTHWSPLMSKILRPVLELLSINEILDFAYSNWKRIKKQSSGRRDMKINMYSELLDFYGIDKAVCLPVFGFDVKFSIECEKKYPDKIIGFGGVKPRASNRKLEKSFEFLKESKVKGIKLHAQYNNFNVKLHENELRRVFQFLEEENMVALFHTGSHFDIKDLTPILKDYEELIVVLGHMGLGPQADQAIDCALKNENVYLETSGQPYDYLIRYAIRNKDIGVGRVLYGSDLPTLDPTVEMMKILSLPISEEEKQAIFWNNAVKIM
ncbi:MAG: amidohydrolase family protein [Candidatus Lokiarchaeota archaeon]|nr:amidohydrolase family protein [Candidatus Lokiarchaeota archaeon]